MLFKFKIWLLYIMSLMGVIKVILYILGYRPIITKSATPDWEAISAIATILLGVLTITIQVADIEHRSQQKQKKLAIFELRYNIYKSLEHLFIFAEFIMTEDISQKDGNNNYVEWFDNNIKNHEVILERLHKCNLLFPQEVASEIGIVSSASTMLFMSIKKLFNFSEKQQIFEGIRNHDSRILKYKKSISDDLEKLYL